MITKQQQEILDNASNIDLPFDNALNEAGRALNTELSKHGEINGDMFDNMKGYLKISIEAYLADLRKKQQQEPAYSKGVISVVKYLEATLPGKESEPCNPYGYYKHYSSIYLKGSGTPVCTIEEFNQCIYDLSLYANKPKGAHAPHTAYDYAQHKLDYPKPKQRMNVEYVKVTDSIFSLRPDLEAGELYLGSTDGEYHQTESEIDVISAISSAALYRKVETKIKTEKRWILIGNEDISRERILHSDKPRYLYEESDLETLKIKKDYQLVAINVDI